MSSIYKITCTANGKFYIGSTMNKAQRWARHRKGLRDGNHPNKNMQASWNKHGEDSFVFEVVEELSEPSLLFAVEQRYLDKCVGQADCFNWSKYAGAPMRGIFGAAHPNFGVRMTEATKELLRAANTGANHPQYGSKKSPETIAKIVEANKSNPWKGQTHTPESIAKIAAASKGRICTEETRAKRSLALKGREVPTAQRLQISRTLSGEGNFWYGKKRSEEFKAKIRRPVRATDGNGTTKDFESIAAMRAELGMTPTTVNRALKAGTPIGNGVFKGWSFKYVAPTQKK